MRFEVKVKGYMIVDSEEEFSFPLFETKFDAEKMAEILNKLDGGENGRK